MVFITIVEMKTIRILLFLDNTIDHLIIKLTINVRLRFDNVVEHAEHEHDHLSFCYKYNLCTQISVAQCIKYNITMKSIITGKHISISYKASHYYLIKVRISFAYYNISNYY